MTRRIHHENERRFLLLALKNPSTENCELQMMLNTPLNWEYIRRQAQLHRISPLLYHRWVARRELAIHIPASARQAFQESYQQTYLRNTLFYRHLARLAAEFRAHNITPIALKGIALAKTIYSSIALRPMQDIDLLLRREDLPQAVEIMQQFGYTNILPHLTYFSRWHQAYEEARFAELAHHGDHLPTFIKQVGAVSICVELHRQLVPGMEFAQVGATPFADGSMPNLLTLTPEYLLFHLCVHLDKHRQIGQVPYLIWYCDIAEVIRTYRKQFDWNCFQAICRKSQRETTVRRILADTAELCGVSIPLPLPADSSDISATIFTDNFSDPDMDFLRNAFRFGWKTGLRYLWESLFPSRAFMQMRYQPRCPRLIYGYYLLRCGKACIRGVRCLKQRIFPAK